MPRGGAREGAGRKKSSLTVRTQDIAKAVASEGDSPLEIMIGNMRFYHEGSQKFTNKLIEVAEKISPDDFIQGSECVRDLFKLVDKVNLYRDRAQACAVDAAPYIHPRLAAIAVSTNPEDELSKAITEKMSPKEAAEIYQALIR